MLPELDDTRALDASAALDAAEVRAAFGAFPSGVAALGAVVDGSPEVLVVSSVTVGVSLDPPLMLFAVQRSSETWPLLRTAWMLGVSVLGAAHVETIRQLAGRDRARRLDGVEHRTTPSGALHLSGCPVRFECTIDRVHPGGDHEVVLLRVARILREEQHEPLLWHRSRGRALG